ncbi:unnamed protein product [Parnassius apollo]|uniref:(apollo) hypothetical protein n=1 Tax=Parnassius apollo TaxID=110799 RepID=A0A8S3W8A0_PARAO|nr:unnamed protein product [Parnassius apollo]
MLTLVVQARQQQQVVGVRGDGQRGQHGALGARERDQFILARQCLCARDILMLTLVVQARQQQQVIGVRGGGQRG